MSVFFRFKKYYELVRKCYIVAFITYLLLSRVVLFVNIVSLPVNSLMYNVFACLGIAILVWGFFSNFYKFKSIENVILVVFLLVCFVSCVLNYKYGIVDNCKTMVWMSIQFFILFYSGDVNDKKYIQDMLNLIMKITCVVWFVTAVISLIQFFFVIRYRAPFSGYSRRQGFIDSRLFGVYSDPNFAAITSIVVIVFSVFLFKNAKSKMSKAFNITNIIAQILYIILSGSRTGHIELVLLIGILAIVFVRNKCIDKGKGLAWIKAIAVAAIMMVVTILGLKILPQPLLEIAKIGEEIKKEVFLDSDNTPGMDVGKEDDNKEDDKDDEKDDVVINLEREDLKEDNISNNRFEIWESAIEISDDSRLFGVSPRNMIAYAKANYPSSYIATTEYETHNGYIAVFVYSGVVGAIVILSLIIYLIYLFVNYLKRNKNKAYSDEMVISVCVCSVVAMSSVMLLDVFFVNTVSAALFWFLAGCFVYLAKCESDKVGEKDVR